MKLPRNAHLWLPGLLSSACRRERVPPGVPIDVLFCIADHFEPAHGFPGLAVERTRVRAWVEQLPELASRFRDADGRPPQHTFFYPAEQYRSEHLDALAGLCYAGFGEVEVHLHHDRYSSEALRRTLSTFTKRLANEHGLLSRSANHAAEYAFIHGNWALDNARADGRFCGVNDEITILRETGCYADFTQPAAPDVSQVRTVNSIYYALDDPARPRSHERGTAARAGKTAPSCGFLLVQGPIAPNWERRTAAVVPGLDVGAIDGSPGYGPLLSRFRRWVDVGITVRDRPEWVFIKVHTHGGPELNARTLLGAEMAAFHAAIGREFNDGRRYRLHYVTAREMFNIVRAAEAGESGCAGDFRDYVLPRPECAAVYGRAAIG